MAMFDFSEPLVLAKGWIEISAAWNDGHIEETAANAPVALVPFHGGAIIVAPSVAGVIERAGVYQCPVHEVATRIVRVFVGIEDISDVEFSNSDNQPVGSLLPRKPVDVCVDVLALAPKIYCLPHEHALHASVREGGAEFVGFTTRKACYAERAAEPKALFNFRVDPEFGARPELQSRIERDVPGFATLVRNKAVRAQIGGTEARRELVQISGLGVEGPDICIWRGDALEVGKSLVVKLIVQPCPHAVNGQIRIEALSASGKEHVGVSEAGEQILGPRCPVRRDRHFDAQ